jgi:hypothetical protein
MHHSFSLPAKVLLALVSTMVLGSESHGTQDHILLFDGAGSLQIASVLLLSLIQNLMLLL